MRKVQLHYTLVGSTNRYRRGIKDVSDEWSNEHTFEFVRSIVADQFGDRALVMMHEDTLKNNASMYPPFFSAGWFISDEDDLTELVVVSHGDSMVAANKSMIDAVQMIEWDEFSARV